VVEAVSPALRVAVVEAGTRDRCMCIHPSASMTSGQCCWRVVDSASRQAKAALLARVGCLQKLNRSCNDNCKSAAARSGQYSLVHVRMWRGTACRSHVSRCFPILYNLTLPKVYDRTFFPKYKSRPSRFRFHCQQTPATGRPFRTSSYS